ncbi:MAG: ATP-dependent helicase [Planctomycetota bacterium]|jgi:DNA helicase-2/ATP-dependent DNA helicase PcrA
MGLIYTESQSKAISHRDGNLLIIACAGSGKTEVISRRLAEIVREGIGRESIVAFTFTERAAGELKARTRKHLEEIIPDDPGIGDMYVGTIHSFCLQLLKELKPEYRNFDIIDEEQQAAFLASNFYDLGLAALRQEHDLRWFDTVRRFRNTLSILYLNNVATEDIPDENLKRSVAEYYEKLKNWPMWFLDFNLIINELIHLLKSNKKIRDKVQSKFKHVVVDEYQDIDPRQEELIQLLVGNGAQLCVVGDDDQAIYGWRGTDITNILTFEERYEDVTQIDMVENFRSTHVIVEVANRAVRQLSSRIDKSMQAVHWQENDSTVKLVETMAELSDFQRVIFDNPGEEAAYIADRIEYLRGVEIKENGENRGLDWGDMAILFRSVRRYAAPLVDELRRRNIPCVVKGTRGLFEHNEILLVQAIFHLIAKEDLWEAIDFRNYRTLNEQDLRQRIRNLIGMLRTSSMPGTDANKVLEWVAQKRRELELASLPKEKRPKRISRRIYPQDIFHEIVDVLGGSENKWSESALYNLGRFSNLLTKYEAVHQWLQPNDLKRLLRFLGNWSLEEGGLNENLTLNAVQILTIHAAKGLEWPAVFIPSIFSYHFPSSMRNRGMEAFLDGSRYASGDDGERRLWYVALTRSKKFLHVSSVSRVRCRPQAFITEITHAYVSDTNVDETERLRSEPVPPINAELLPTTFSDLNYYWNCPYDYQLRRLMGFGPRIGQEFGYGQQIHNLLAAVHEAARDGEILDDKSLWSIVEKNFSLRYTSEGPFENMKNAAFATVGNYLGDIGKRLPSLVLEVEKPFEFILEGALVSGTIDLLEQIDAKTGKYTPVGVVDFKTGIDDDPLEFKERLETSKKQVILYAIAAREALRLNPQKARVHFLDTQKQVQEEVVIEEKERNVLVDLVGNTVSKIKTGQFPRKPKSGKQRCKKCDFKKICPGKC